MELLFISPFSEQAFHITWLEINTPVGNMVVQPGHAPMIITLSDNEKVTFGLSNGKRESILVKSAIVHITRTSVTVLMSGGDC